MIDRSASEAKEKINDIIWAINPENDDWEIFVAKCRRFAADTFDSRDMNYTIKMDSSGYGHDKLQIRQELWLAFKEIITNVARHSEATEVSVNMTSDRNMLNLVISDNGKGISKAAMEKGNGLKNIEKRIREIDGKAELKTKEGEGTTWKISISD
jgi:signal transduction histidine kinase